jgi:peptide chain release factor 2
MNEKMLEENFWDDRKVAQAIINSGTEAKEKLDTFKLLDSTVVDLINLCSELKDVKDDSLQEMLDNESSSLFIRVEKFEVEMLLSAPYDKNDAIISIHPGAGGTESQDWASMLFRMYTRWCEINDYSFDILDYQDGDEAGIKSVELMVKGKNAYGYLKAEKGVHRLVRISPFDANKRRHTSFASVDVVPSIDEDINITINPEDLRIDTYRASGAGGQHVNKTDSAVRITHIPTNTVVSCQTQRSQIQNRELAMQMLKSKLYAIMVETKKDELDQIRGEQRNIEWGSQIRSYVFCPYTMVKDHRTNYEYSDVRKVMDGNIDDFIFAFLKAK